MYNERSKRCIGYEIHHMSRARVSIDRPQGKSGQARRQAYPSYEKREGMGGYYEKVIINDFICMFCSNYARL